MISLLRIRCLCFCLAITMLASTSAWSQQTYRLRDLHEVGDVLEAESTLEMNLSMHPIVDGKKLTPIVTSSRNREKYQETILSVDEKGNRSAFRRSYSIAQGIETESGSKPKPRVSPLKGKTVTVTRNGEKFNVTVTPGKITESERKTLTANISDQPEIFPDRDLAPGDEWAIDARGLLKSLAKGDKAEVRAKFLEVVSFQGRQCARIQLTMEVTQKLENSPLTMTMKLRGDGYQALDLQRLISLKIGGPITIKGDSTPKKDTPVISGKGTMKMDLAQRWIKIAGKPPATPAATTEAIPTQAP